MTKAFAPLLALALLFTLPAHAESFIKERAEQGDANAQLELGVVYEYGRGVPQDHATAVTWYKKAAEQGKASAQFNLGLMYDNGQGVPQDDVKAHVWWNLAAALGDKSAMKNRDLIAEDMTPARIAKAQEAARACLARGYQGC